LCEARDRGNGCKADSVVATLDALWGLALRGSAGEDFEVDFGKKRDPSQMGLAALALSGF